MSDPYRRPYRWAVLAAYLPVVGLSQLLWLNFAPILDLVQQRYGVSEFMASNLILVFPLIFVLLSTHAGLMVDSRGYRFTIGAGAIVMAVSSVIRIFDDTFTALLIGQIGIALAQPYIVNGISKLVGDWFIGEQSALAFGIGTMGMYLGMAVSMAATPWLVHSTSLRTTMIICAVISVIGAILFYAVVKPNDQAPPSPASTGESIRPLLRNRELRIIFVISFLGLGEFNGLTTWLEQILKPYGVSEEDAGLAGAALIVGGIFGAVIIPALSGFARRRKPFLLLSAGMAAVTLYPLCTTGRLPVLLALGFAHGFFLLPAMALMLDLASQIAGERLAGAATGVLMLTGNAGGVLAVLAVPALKGPGDSYRVASIMLVALLGAAFLLAARLTELAPATAHHGRTRDNIKSQSSLPTPWLCCPRRPDSPPDASLAQLSAANTSVMNGQGGEDQRPALIAQLTARRDEALAEEAAARAREAAGREGVKRSEPSQDGVKACPFCAETVQGVAIKCKHRGEQLDRSRFNWPRLIVTAAIMFVVALFVSAFANGMLREAGYRDTARSLSGEYGFQFSPSDVRSMTHELGGDDDCTGGAEAVFWATWIGGVFWLNRRSKSASRVASGSP